MTSKEAAAEPLNDISHMISLTDFEFNLISMSHIDNDLKEKRKILFPECNNKNFHYQLYEATGQDEEDKLDNQTAAMVECHICNLTVPETHLADHKKSVKHDVCLKLTKEAIDRTHKQLSNEICNSETEKINPATYYCASCNLNIDIATRGTHDDGIKHKLAAKRDKLFSVMLKIYMNDTITDDETVLQDEFEGKGEDAKKSETSLDESFMSCCCDEDSKKMQATALANADMKILVKKDHDTPNIKLVSSKPVKLTMISEEDKFNAGVRFDEPLKSTERKDQELCLNYHVNYDGYKEFLRQMVPDNVDKDHVNAEPIHMNYGASTSNSNDGFEESKTSVQNEISHVNAEPIHMNYGASTSNSNDGFDEFKTSVQNEISQAVAVIKQELEEIKKKLEAVDDTKKLIKTFETQAVEAQSRSIVIYGLKRYEGETDLDLYGRIVSMFIDILNVNLLGAIEEITRIGKKSYSRPVKVVFCSKILARLILNCATNLKHKEVSIAPFVN